jgi:hypothetical protein
MDEKASALFELPDEKWRMLCTEFGLDPNSEWDRENLTHACRAYVEHSNDLSADPKLERELLSAFADKVIELSAAFKAIDGRSLDFAYGLSEYWACSKSIYEREDVHDYHDLLREWMFCLQTAANIARFVARGREGERRKREPRRMALLNRLCWFWTLQRRPLKRRNDAYQDDRGLAVASPAVRFLQRVPEVVFGLVISPDGADHAIRAYQQESEWNDSITAAYGPIYPD